jgi:hypothetical protein
VIEEEGVTAKNVESMWAYYGYDEPLRPGFAEWLAAQMTTECKPPVAGAIMAEITVHYPECIGTDTWRLEPARKWVSKTFVEWPEPTTAGKAWVPRRYRMIGVRGDGELFQAVGHVPALAFGRANWQAILADLERQMGRDLDRYLNADLDGVKAP